jgi:formiminotetrahydrofolate cyclodeaminase
MPSRATQSPIRNSTIESFREHVAKARDPIAAGVAVAAIAAGLGMSLLALTLKVTSRRKKSSGDQARIRALLDAANKESAKLVRCADQDIAAYQKYRDSLRRKRSSDATLRRVIESPLEAAGSAARGVALCVEAVSLVPLSVASDLGAAAALMAGAMTAILLTVDVNLRELPAASDLRRSAGRTRRALESRSARQVERVLERVARRINGQHR